MIQGYVRASPKIWPEKWYSTAIFWDPGIPIEKFGERQAILGL